MNNIVNEQIIIDSLRGEIEGIDMLPACYGSNLILRIREINNVAEETTTKLHMKYTEWLEHYRLLVSRRVY